MTISKKNWGAVVIWLIPIVSGAFGLINPFGLIGLLIPVLFIVFGTNFTKGHAKEYINVLVAYLILYLIAFVIHFVLPDLTVVINVINWVAYAYLLVMSVLGLLSALLVKKFKAPFAFRLL